MVPKGLPIMFALEKLSRAEKLQMMEALWRDLTANAAELPPSAWHSDALRQAEAEQAKGSAQMMDWAEAKNLLRRRAQS